MEVFLLYCIMGKAVCLVHDTPNTQLVRVCLPENSIKLQMWDNHSPKMKMEYFTSDNRFGTFEAIPCRKKPV